MHVACVVRVCNDHVSNVCGKQMTYRVDVHLDDVVLGIKWMNGMVKRRLRSGGWTEI